MGAGAGHTGAEGGSRQAWEGGGMYMVDALQTARGESAISGRVVQTRNVFVTLWKMVCAARVLLRRLASPAECRNLWHILGLS